MIRSGKQTGYILLPVIVVITLVAAIALLMNTESALESNTAATELDARQAQYVAEAGLNHALWLSQQQGCGPHSNLADEPLGNDKYSSVLTTDLGSTTAVTIDVDQDSWIRSDQPTVNNGADLRLHTRNETIGTERPLIRYDLSPITPNAPILSATAWFHLKDPHPNFAGPINIHLTSADWAENDATWDSMSTNMDSAVLATIPGQPVAGVWVAVNLTAQVQAWVNGQANYGITLNSVVDGVHAEYESRESANPPYIDVITGDPPSSSALLKAVGKLANGVTRNITRTDVTLRQQPASTVLWQHDAMAGVDAYIWEFAPTTAYGNDDETWVSYSNNNDSLSLFKFNVDRLLPGTKILDATLSLLHQSGAGSNIPISAHRIVNSWDEADVTWRKRVSGTDWDTFGGDLDDREVSTTLVGPASNVRYEWDLTSLAQGWADSAYPNYGVALRTTQTNAFGERFYTSDETIESRRPRLTINYACACGEVCLDPQGSGNLLMIVINPTTLVAEDQQARDLFESWGYTVSVLGESENQASYDAAVAINDVVFISETVNVSQVGSKLQNAPIGVVSQDGDYNPDLGLATGSTLKVGADINITDTDHYITRLFSTGPLQVYTDGMEQLVTSGTLTADQQTLADIGGDASLVVLDTGAAMEGGGAALGRRVILPLGTRYRFDWDRLSANGRLLVQRSLAWGSGIIVESTAINILFVVPDATSLGAQDTAKQTLMESWDFDVTLITAAESQANIDAAMASADVVYISEEVLSADIGSKLRDAVIGVVNEETALTDEFGISSSHTGYSGTAIEIVDNTHYVTSVFAVGSLTIASSSAALDRRSGTLAPGLDALAQTAGNPELATIETGGQLYDSGTASGRRVQLPWGTDDFDINLLTADGQTVMRRALEWGAGAGTASVPKNVLFVVANVGGPGMTTEEIAHQTLIESWGYTVEIIDDGASQTDFDTAVANNDVVFTTNDINATTLGTKLVNATIGVVTSEDNLSDEFGMASAIAWESGTLVEINDNTHYITSPFPTGTLTIFTASESLAYVTGSLSPDLGLLASSASGYAIVTLEAGDALFGGGNAAGRRAQLPWGGSGFDPGNLNADGLEILKRALEWGAGEGPDTGPVAHWKLDETSGLTALDSAGGNDGTLVGVPDWAPALIDGGLDFDGSNDYVDAGSFDVIGSGITLMGWFNASAIATDDPRIISKANGTNEADAWWQLSIVDVGSNRYLRMRIKAGGTTTTFADASTNLSTDQWYLAVATYDNASGDMKLYLNGVEIASASHAVGGAVDTDATVPVALGANGAAERLFDGLLDDLRVYNYALPASEIVDLFTANPPPGSASYTELSEAWSATTSNTWQTVDLSAYGVPANAVVEVALENKQASGEFWAGARAVGSGLERRFLLHEAEGGGVDTVTLHVQTDASSQIQHYSGSAGFVSFRLLGYWDGAVYVERFDAFKAGANASWQSHDLGAYGVGPDQVAEIALSQTSTSIEWLVGARRPGSGLARQVSLHEAEGGGIDMVTLMAATDASSLVEVYAEADSVVDFHLLGYWSTPPGTYTETGGVQGQATVSASWQTTDLSGFGIPANAIAQFVLSNERDARENSMGLRETASTINDRRLDLQEAESGGGDLASMHVKVDASSQIQWAAEYGATEGFFYPVGWWDLSP